MSYRIEPKKSKKPNRTAQKVTTPARYFMTNGTTFSLAIPCWYQEILPPVRAKHHCKDWHDFIGRPSPNHPDHSCQIDEYAAYHRHMEHPHHNHHIHSHFHHDRRRGHVGHYIDMASLIPIHLYKEGYRDVFVATDKQYDGLNINGYIDNQDDWIVRVDFSAAIEEALDDPVDIKFIIKVENDKTKHIDTVSLGKLIIMPAPLEED